jgi:uncharacterized protein (DUF2147 family)
MRHPAGPTANAHLPLALLFGLPTTARAATPVGLWYAEGSAAQVEIRPCGAQLCGRVVWLRPPFNENGCDLRDRYNPDPELRARPIVGRLGAASHLRGGAA